MSRLRGSMVALVTPLRDGAVDEAALRALARWQIEKGTAGLVPCGTTGEGATVTADEHFRIVRACAEEARGRVPVIAGCGSNDTRKTIDNVPPAKVSGARLRRVLCRRSGEGAALAEQVRQPGQGDVLRDQPDAGEARAVSDGKDLSRAAAPAGSHFPVGRNPCRGGDARVRRPAVIRAVVAGAGGRMGSRILAALRAEKDFALTGALERV